VARYAALVAAGAITDDPAQRALATRLDQLDRALTERRLAAKSSPLGWFFASKASPPRGLYIHGEVGRGKTMLMDAFFGVAAPRRKRRTHFNEFMADVHERIHIARQSVSDRAKSPDPIAPVAAAIAEEVRLLCLDEFAVTDVADALILARLFEQLFARGLVLVATSNVAPDLLYREGLNRGLFLPFIEDLKRHTDVVELTARADFRLEKLGVAPVYVTPLGEAARLALDRAWHRLTGTNRGEPASLAMKGRVIRVPEADKGVARFGFADLCQVPLGAADFIKIARAFHTVLIDDIPVIGDDQRNEARRFISVIDEFYDNRVKLVVSAAAEPAALYTASDGEEAFAFRRTVSRLIEMRSTDYLAAPHGATGVAR
jgi:cell division protein ZapE